MTIGGGADGQIWGLSAAENKTITGLQLTIAGAWSTLPDNPVAAWSISIDGGSNFSALQAPSTKFGAFIDGFAQRAIGSSSFTWGFDTAAWADFNEEDLLVKFTHPDNNVIWYWDHLLVDIYIEGTKSPIKLTAGKIKLSSGVISI